MTKYRIRIELLSDLCVSDGGKYNSSVDTDICHDGYGFPYIPAKRLKGCLRECAQELNDWGDNLDIDGMFGTAGNCQGGSVIIRDAVIDGHEDGIAEIEKNKTCPVFHPQNILNAFSYLRYQTSINYETGIAEGGSLRSMRVADKGLVFYAKIEPGCYKKEIERCLTILRHMGIARTRGFGEIRASLEETEDTEKGCCNHVSYRAGSREIRYQIRLLTPVICKSVNGQEENSMDYIEGAKIIGLLGQAMKENRAAFLKLLDSKTLKFSNAYISDGEERYTEMPASFLNLKNQKAEYRNRVYETEAERALDTNAQPMQAKHCYISRVKQGTFQRLDVEIEERYHHSRGIDKSVGRATGEEDSKFYQISSINEGQCFEGFIRGTEEEIHAVYSALSLLNQVSLGYGRNGEYGVCDFSIKGLSCNEPEKRTGQEFYVKLNAPTIVYGSNAAYSTKADDLIAETAAALDISKEKITKVRKYLRTIPVGGFNVTWGYRKPTMEAFDKGTVLSFECKEEISILEGRIFLGERTKEGYGETEVFLNDKNEGYQLKLVDEKENGDSIDMPMIKLPVFDRVLERMYRDYLRSLAVNEVRDLKEEKESAKKMKGVWRDDFRPVVSNMLLMSKDADTLNDMRQFVEVRFGRASTKKREKGSIAKEILDRADGKDLQTGFCEENRIVEFDYHGREKMEYLIDLLTELKYVVRTGKEAEK